MTGIPLMLSTGRGGSSWVIELPRVLTRLFNLRGREAAEVFEARCNEEGLPGYMIWACNYRKPISDENFLAWIDLFPPNTGDDCDAETPWESARKYHHDGTWWQPMFPDEPPKYYEYDERGRVVELKQEGPEPRPARWYEVLFDIWKRG